ncbi:hypothetical protein SAMD00019534_113920 [Acytostelium subglobosum LB1]|uniref:hypothetical protein n=1 Tax=Acytostelium subglobosum LB1 TaxID=1410327 RepID=UPI00064505CF|nr:hypothetical protein SAMD00019534_113920 [Acytostelium subglobosum LB1]GAM28216.1 hypothetical protein SAMD00019534_113920 [Acytostelium subglobosum LB1]|eukprot:XP_012748850.1 hypothetical protein SAMD00019534_113920 [Acytostelium subglobosum LB1]
MVCAICSVQRHNGHKLDHIENIRQQCLKTKINDNDNNNNKDIWCTSRLNHLWTTLQHSAKTYQSLKQTYDEVTGHFEQLIKVIMAQEYRVKKPIEDQMEKIQSTIKDIIKEIKDINHLINMAYPPEYFGGDDHAQTGHRDEVEMSQVIQSIATCSTIDQYAISLHGQFVGKRLALGDIELLSMVTRHAQHTRDVPYDDGDALLRARRVNTDIDKLNGIKKQIEECFQIIDTPGVVETIRGGIISMKQQQCSFFSKDSDTWTEIGDTLQGNLHGVFHSVIYAHNNIYVFGGFFVPFKFLRYSLADRQCYKADIAGIDECNATSLCYDGDKYIYIIGGYNRNIRAYLKRLDRFDIDTQQFTRVGRIEVENARLLCSRFTFFLNNRIYIIIHELLAVH